MATFLSGMSLVPKITTCCTLKLGPKAKIPIFFKNIYFMATFVSGMSLVPTIITYCTLKWGPKTKQNLKFFTKLDDWRDHGL